MEREWKFEFEEYLELANEYQSYAKDALKEEKVRLCIDAGYNAIELLVKALIISKGRGLASSRGEIFQQLGEIFVNTGEINKELGGNVLKALMLRAEARYVPTAKLERKDGEFVISIAEEILELARKNLETQE
jgi:uncharacterized protein (UPF0332 family)